MFSVRYQTQRKIVVLEPAADIRAAGAALGPLFFCLSFYLVLLSCLSGLLFFNPFEDLPFVATIVLHHGSAAGAGTCD